MAADRHAVSAKESGSCAKGEPGDSRTYSSYSMVKDIVSVSSSFEWSGSKKKILIRSANFCVQRKSRCQGVGGEFGRVQ